MCGAWAKQLPNEFPLSATEKLQRALPAAAAVSVASTNFNGDADTESAAYAAAGLRIQGFVVLLAGRNYCLSVWLIIK